MLKTLVVYFLSNHLTNFNTPNSGMIILIPDIGVRPEGDAEVDRGVLAERHVRPLQKRLREVRRRLLLLFPVVYVLKLFLEEI